MAAGFLSQCSDAYHRVVRFSFNPADRVIQQDCLLGDGLAQAVDQGDHSPADPPALGLHGIAGNGLDPSIHGLKPPVTGIVLGISAEPQLLDKPFHPGVYGRPVPGRAKVNEISLMVRAQYPAAHPVPGLQHGKGLSPLGQKGCGVDAAYAGADDDCLGFFLGHDR